jgi:hypothetical protein
MTNGVNMHNIEWTKAHIGHLEYARDQALAEADYQRLNWMANRRYESFRLWKAAIQQAWSFRRMIRENKRGAL